MEGFVVGLDRSEVLRRRASVRRTRLVGGVVVIAFSAVGVGLSVELMVLLGDSWPVGLLMMAAFVLPVVAAVRGLWTNATMKRWYAAADVPPFALRMTAASLELGVEGAQRPLVVPWEAVRGFRRRLRFGQPILEVELRPGIQPITPGVTGLEQPAVQKMVRPSRLTKGAGLYGIASLDQPVEAIDQALRYFSRGGVGVSG
ncbi:hypothetical protein FB561_3497 [Kribbella amoyensis]|uniref:Uncharacterized protein n=1 Tax=Kribbella amoyensis TaxID=996641 RepID=A0A561BU04_9ACTN|nr:hypothetical protein [Kribbella amoyensis]TWD82367.1 hypothetical protein FB561_3497 [Kribbella amoyensis]